MIAVLMHCAILLPVGFRPSTSTFESMDPLGVQDGRVALWAEDIGALAGGRLASVCTCVYTGGLLALTQRGTASFLTPLQ